MTLAEKVSLVETLFSELDAETASFRKESGLYCKAGCGKCCLNPDIHATILEFLPLAYSMVKAGKADELYDRILSKGDTLCISLDLSGLTGLCSNYHHRGLICRLFGYSARINKYKEAEMITCSIIKTELASSYQHVVKKLQTGEATIPVSHHYYSRLSSIDEELGKTLYPINVAIRKALEVVMQYDAYLAAEGQY